MNPEKEIYAPSLYLFAFTTFAGLDTDFQAFPKDMEKQIQESIKTNYISILKPIFNLTPVQEIENEVQLNPNAASKYILADDFKSRILKQNKFPHIANISPQKIGDTYALNLALECDEQLQPNAIKTEELKVLNPNNCLNIETNLGKIIIFTALIEEWQKANVKQIQKDCLNAILPLENQPKFYSQSEIFNGDIFIYGNPKSLPKSESYQQVWLIFFTQKEDRQKLEQIYYDLPELFLEFHKIINAFHSGKKEYKLADQEMENFGKILQNVKGQYGLHSSNENQTLPKINLLLLKNALKTILTRSLTFSEIARKLELQQNALTVNIYNYQKSCQQLETQTNQELLLLNSFATREFNTFKQEIESNIKYVSQGSLLIQEAVSTIRGLIEIDQAESARNLEITFTALGFGIGIGGIIASQTGQITADNPIYFPWQPEAQLNPIHPFVGFTVLSIFAGVATGILTRYILRWLLKNK